jgi:hypothetical protein
MHPILAHPGRLAAYIAIWLPLGALLAGLLALQGVFGWTHAAIVAIPLSVSYGFLCLSAWYVTGGRRWTASARRVWWCPRLLLRFCPARCGC